MSSAVNLGESKVSQPLAPVIGVCATGDYRLTPDNHVRCKNIITLVAKALAGQVKNSDGEAVKIVYSPVLIWDETSADTVARQFKEAGVNIIVCAPDTWSFPQLTLMSLLAHFPKDTPVNVTCGNSGPKPGVVFAHAVTGALAQSGRLIHLNVGTWPDTGENPPMSPSTAEALIDWCYAAVTTVSMRGRRVLIWGHDSMGMETALQHIMPTRKTFGLEIARLDMKLLADLMEKGAYNAEELKELRAWIDKNMGERLIINSEKDCKSYNHGLSMYLVIRDMAKQMNAIGGGFMNQLEWGSDKRGICLPCADTSECLFNSTFDHHGKKAPFPFATEADCQALLTMLIFTGLSGGNPPLFMDFRKVWESWEIQQLAKKLGVSYSDKDSWAMRGFVDGDNSGSASLDWAGKPGENPAELFKRIRMPLADPDYFPGGGNSVTFVTPGGIEGIAGRLAYSSLNNLFSMVWDEAVTVDLPPVLSEAVAHTSNYDWPHTWVQPKYASMAEYKQFAPANHFHMTWNLRPARLQYWMDLVNVLSLTPWQARPGFIENVDRPQPLIHLMNGGEALAKALLAK